MSRVTGQERRRATGWIRGYLRPAEMRLLDV